MSKETLTSYSGVTLSEEEMSSLNGSFDDSAVEQTTAGEHNPQESEVVNDQSAPEEEQLKDSETVESLELDGAEYDYDTIKEALEAFNNKQEWQKSNTEKAQEISAERKALDAEVKVWNELRKNDDAMAALQDVLDEDHPLFSNEVRVAEEEQTQDTKNSDNDRILALEERLNEIARVREQEQLDIEADRQVTADIATLKQSHPELEDQKFLDQVIQTAVDKGFTGLEGLEDAYALTYHKAADDSAFKTAVNRARNAKAMKSVPESEGAVKGIHEEPKTIPKTYKEAQADALKNYNFYE